MFIQPKATLNLFWIWYQIVLNNGSPIMRLLKFFCLFLILVACQLIFQFAGLPTNGEISYVQPATIPFDWDTTAIITKTFHDSISGDFLQQAEKLDGTPLYFSRDIMTSVCFDDKCRPLDLTIYWNITGRYLGFRLPQEEFLSRYDHEPFTAKDYRRLNALLADPHLPFRGVSFEELIQPAAVELDSVDGVSGATAKSLSAHVVEGAAYTTYTMWNIVYGPTQSAVRKMTEEQMTPALLAQILKSSSSEDQIWGLRKIDGSKPLEATVADAVLDIIGNEDYFPAYTAIEVLQPVHLTSEKLQTRLFAKYEQVNYSLRKPIIEKLKEAPELSPEVIKRSRKLLTDLNGEQLGHMLNLYSRHAIYDRETNQAVIELLKKNNRFIAGKAYQYLNALPGKDDAVLQALEEYRSK